MNINPFADANKASVATLFGLSGQALQGVEQLAALNLQVIKTLLAECAEGTQAALSATSPTELVELQTTALLAAPQKAIAYGRQVQEIFITVADGQRATVHGALKNTPGSESIQALVKSTVAAAAANVTRVTETAVNTSRNSLATIDA